jgi:hypothetical protein
MIVDEFVSDQPGSWAIINHLVQVVFVRGIREHLAAIPPDGGRVLLAAPEPQAGFALYLQNSFSWKEF